MKRPMPPESVMNDIFGIVEPSPELAEWVRDNIIDDSGEIHNPDHAHLIGADIKFMWASYSFHKKGRTVLGQCEEVMIRAGGWQKVRAEQQMRDWFGHTPQFIITLSAQFCVQCTDADFCALVEHELYHIAQEIDENGIPKFTKYGTPKLCMRGHDVEEFNGVVRRYGASQEVAEMAKLADSAPEVSRASIARSCGTCILKAV